MDCEKVFSHHSHLKNGRCWSCDHKRVLKCSRRDAVAWARETIRLNCLIVDTETTGLEYDDEIIQLAIVDLDGSVLFESRFRPSAEMTPGAEDVHGMSAESLADAPYLPTDPEIRKILQNRVVAAYNGDFDERMLRRYNLSCVEWCDWR